MNETYTDHRIAVIADTHVPDRRNVLHPDLLDSLRAIKPDLILHAGDITIPAVIRELELVAPVIAVRGNRDFVFFSFLPLVKDIIINGKQLTLVHGHTGFIGYLINKVRTWIWKYDLNWFLPWLLYAGEDADVIIFGHTHRAVNCMIEGKLFFNPGSVNVPPQNKGALSFGLLTIDADGNICGEVRKLSETV